MHYVFFDESWKGGELFTSAVLVPQGRYGDHIRHAKFQSRETRLFEINQFLSRVNGYGAVCRINLEEPWLIEKTEDSCSDIPRMARRDNVWSWGVAYAVDCALIAAEKRRETFSKVDVYHDPKSLTSEHLEAFYDLLRRHLVSLLRDVSKRCMARGLKKLSMGTIKAIPKAVGTESPNKFQYGIWMADQIMRSGYEAISRRSNIGVTDVTRYILNTVGRWKEGELV